MIINSKAKNGIIFAFFNWSAILRVCPDSDLKVKKTYFGKNFAKKS
jgi:hypothetical protein